MNREWMVLIAIGVLCAAWVLLPLIPAILIYKLFPSSTVAVNGPFAGLTVKAGGAFAGYLIVFAGTYYPIIPPTRDIIAGWQRQFWVLKGDVKLVRDDFSDYPRSGALLNKLRVVKPLSSKFEGAQATLKIEEEEGELPTVIIEIPEFGDKVIPLRSMADKMTVDHFKKVITMKEPIIIQENSPGGATRPALSLRSRSEQATTESGDRESSTDGGLMRR